MCNQAYLRPFSHLEVHSKYHSGKVLPGLALIGQRCIVPVVGLRSQVTPPKGYSSWASPFFVFNFTSNWLDLNPSPATKVRPVVNMGRRDCQPSHLSCQHRYAKRLRKKTVAGLILPFVQYTTVSAAVILQSEPPRGWASCTWYAPSRLFECVPLLVDDGDKHVYYELSLASKNVRFSRENFCHASFVPRENVVVPYTC